MINKKLIRKKMIDKEIDGKKIAEILNINQNTISRWINGKNTQQIENFIKFINFLEIDSKEIIKKDS